VVITPTVTHSIPVRCCYCYRRRLICCLPGDGYGSRFVTGRLVVTVTVDLVVMYPFRSDLRYTTFGLLHLHTHYGLHTVPVTV